MKKKKKRSPENAEKAFEKELLAEINGEVTRQTVAATVLWMAIVMAIVMAACVITWHVRGVYPSAAETPAAEVTQEELDKVLSVEPTWAVEAADEALGGQGTAEEWIDALKAADPDAADVVEEILGR